MCKVIITILTISALFGCNRDDRGNLLTYIRSMELSVLIVTEAELHSLPQIDVYSTLQIMHPLGRGYMFKVIGNRNIGLKNVLVLEVEDEDSRAVWNDNMSKYSKILLRFFPRESKGMLVCVTPVSEVSF